MPRPSPLLALIGVAVCAHVALAAARVTTSLYALSLHASEFTVGTLIALFALFPMLLAVKMGRIIDRIGIYQPLRFGALIGSAGVLVAAAAQSVAMLYLAAVLIGTGFMAIFIATQYAVGTLLEGEEKTAGFSQLAVGFSISAFIGPMMAGFTIDHAGHAMAFLACSVFTLIAFVIASSATLRHLPAHQSTSHRARRSALELLAHRELRGLYFVGITLAAAWDLFTFMVPVRGTQLGFSASTIGLILATFSVATFTVRIVMPWIVRRYHEWRILSITLSAAALCYLLLPFTQQPLAMGMAAFALGLALGSGQPNVLALLHSGAPAGRGAEAIAIRASLGNLSSVSLPLAYGALGVALGPFAVFWGLGAVIACAAPVAARRARKVLREQSAQSKLT
ncbi:MAG: MFS transporter [Burkholderiaceae bacterium]